MENIVFISSVELVSVNKYCKLRFNIFDKNHETSSFNTSLMTKYNAEKYEKSALELIKNPSWIRVIYGINPPEFTLILDTENNGEIMGLAHENGMLLKNEVKYYTQEYTNEFLQ